MADGQARPGRRLRKTSCCFHEHPSQTSVAKIIACSTTLKDLNIFMIENFFFIAFPH